MDFYRYLNPYPMLWFAFWKLQTFGKSLETLCSWILFLRFLKSLGWYEFFYGYLVVLNVFHQCFV
jgi:hypothetical protein